MTQTASHASEFILASEVTLRIPFSANHLRRLEAQGDFPKRIRLGANRIAWLRAEVEHWIATKVEAR